MNILQILKNTFYQLTGKNIDFENTKIDSTQYTQKDTIITRCDKKVIVNKDVPELIVTGLKHTLEDEKTSINPKFHRTEKEERFSFNFTCKHGSKLSKHETILYNSVSNIGKCGNRWMKKASIEELQDKIEKCNIAITVFNTFKSFCYQTKGGTIYFQDMWEYCHNSKSECFSYIDSVLELKTKLKDELSNRERW